MANTKLSTFGATKKQLKGMVKALGTLADFYVLGNTVLLVVKPFEGANTVRVACSSAAPDEQKFRPKVGQYLAITHYNMDNFITMSIDDFDVMYCDTPMLTLEGWKFQNQLN